ncbi:MAG: hypothetical protein KTR30_08795 [Saprospiraceae bacterium]|nr:hypothetical protein [Saprospiraceae bacterium]
MNTKRIFLLLSFAIVAKFTNAQKVAEHFEFQFEENTLRGLIEKPKDSPAKAIVVLIPGYGPTNYVEGNWYASLRNQLVDFGLAVVFWDKMGCGGSEGDFDINQPVQSSAEEALIAIKKLQKQPEYESLKIGLWGVSRAGWICPLIIDQHPIDFWISVSGTDDKETFGYMLKSNLIIHGKTEKEAQSLYDAWAEGQRVFYTGGTYEAAEAATRPLDQDSLCRALFGYGKEPTKPKAEREKEYYHDQERFTKKGFFDGSSGLWVYLLDFDKTLSRISCPVLAIFGENDSQVDWKRTKTYYEQHLGQQSADQMEIKTLPQCNHNIQKCDSCGFKEDLSKYQWQACPGYYETMKQWLEKQGLI